jgi:iron complex outermembrane recepter protein
VYGTGSSSANGINFPGINTVSTKAVIAPNPDLKPQTSKSYTGGFDLKPLERLTLSADYYYIDFSGLVGQEAPQLLINQYIATGANADRLIFDPTGKTLITIDLHNINASSVKTSGFDFAANYELPTAVGRFTLNGAATVLSKYDYQQTAGGVILDGVGGSNQGTSIPALPKWKSDLTLSWQLGGHNVMAATHYTSGLTNPAFALTSPLQDTASYTTQDLYYSYSWSQLTLRAGIQNLFDRLPPFQAGQQFYPLFAGVYDPRGRMFNLDAKVSF